MIEVIDIKTLIENALKKSIKLKEVFIKNNWKDIVGEIDKKSFPKTLKDSTLYIITENSVISHYLSMRENMIVEKCNKLIQENYIKNIRIKVGPVQVEKMKYCGGKNE
jgi:predicted nucleic acid-binding Zn ribbon protein